MNPKLEHTVNDMLCAHGRVTQLNPPGPLALTEKLNKLAKCRGLALNDTKDLDAWPANLALDRQAMAA